MGRDKIQRGDGMSKEKRKFEKMGLDRIRGKAGDRTREEDSGGEEGDIKSGCN